LKEAPQYQETQLLSRIAAGDECAFRSLFDLYKGRVTVYALRLSKSRYVAEEIVQEIFLKLWTNREQLTEVQNIGTYIYVMAKNRTLDHLKKIANEDRLFNEVWHTISEQGEPTGHLYAKDNMRLIEKAIGQLSPQKQKIFYLSRFEGLSHHQIAEQCALSKNTVKNHLVKTLRHIKFFLKQHNVTLLIPFLILFS
jgi:RNA polymerase sigma-70 factor (ECF subfamily)